MMPFLCREFHVLPWHFGGEPYLTYPEINSFLEAAKQYADEQKDAERKMKSSKTRGRR